MINGTQRRHALAVMRIVWRNFGAWAFRVDPAGQHWQGLRYAERLGWAHWRGNDICQLTEAGVGEITGCAEGAD